MTRTAFSAIVLICVLVLSVSAFANSGELLNFNYLPNDQPVGNFYNGAGPAGVPNYGVSFSSNFYGLRSFLTGGSGNFSPTLAGTSAIFLVGALGSPVTGVMNVSPGFSSGINFFYTALFAAGQSETVTIWSGTNGSGTVLATIVLGTNDASCGFPLYCNWSGAGASFSGTAHSVTFSGPADELGISDITIGSSTTALPESSAVYLLGTGIVAISAGKMRKLLGR